MHSKRRTSEEIAIMAGRATTIGLSLQVNQYCTTKEMQDFLVELQDYLDIKYGLEYACMMNTNHSSDPDGDLKKVLDAYDTIKAYSDRYDVPQLTHNQLLKCGSRKKVLKSPLEDLETIIKHLRPPPPKQVANFRSMLRGIVEEKINATDYNRKDKIIDAVMVNFFNVDGWQN